MHTPLHHIIRAILQIIIPSLILSLRHSDLSICDLSQQTMETLLVLTERHKQMHLLQSSDYPLI